MTNYLENSMKTIYEEISESLNSVRTLASHLVAIGKLKQKSEDPKLQELIERVIKEMQATHIRMKSGKSTPIAAVSATANASWLPSASQLDALCKRMIAMKTPEWQVLARRAGWAPPATPQNP